MMRTTQQSTELEGERGAQRKKKKRMEKASAPKRAKKEGEAYNAEVRRTTLRSGVQRRGQAYNAEVRRTTPRSGVQRRDQSEQRTWRRRTPPNDE
jgi:hypothetical protein